MMAAKRPRLTLAGPLLRGSGELHVVGSEEFVTLPDPDGALQRLLELADGWHSRAEILAALAAEFPRLGRDAERLLAELESSGLIEDAAPRSRAPLGRGPRRDADQRALFAGPARAI